MTSIPKPEVDIGLLQSGPSEVSAPAPTFSDPNFGVPNDQGQPEVDVASLPGVPGQRGPQGPKGDKGDTGPAGSSFIYTQNAVSSTWHITHSMGFYPAVTTTDITGFVIEGNVSYTDTNSLTVTFAIATTGKAYLS